MNQMNTAPRRKIKQRCTRRQTTHQHSDEEITKKIPEETGRENLKTEN